VNRFSSPAAEGATARGVSLSAALRMCNTTQHRPMSHGLGNQRVSYLALFLWREWAVLDLPSGDIDHRLGGLAEVAGTAFCRGQSLRAPQVLAQAAERLLTIHSPALSSFTNVPMYCGRGTPGQ
jgi:hypothetical protein